LRILRYIGGISGRISGRSSGIIIIISGRISGRNSGVISCVISISIIIIPIDSY
jgi:hypothetical protein